MQIVMIHTYIWHVVLVTHYFHDVYLIKLFKRLYLYLYIHGVKCMLLTLHALYFYKINLQTALCMSNIVYMCMC